MPKNLGCLLPFVVGFLFVNTLFANTKAKKHIEIQTIQFSYNQSFDTAVIVDYPNYKKTFKLVLSNTRGEKVKFNAIELPNGNIDTLTHISFGHAFNIFDTSADKAELIFADIDFDLDKEVIITNSYGDKQNSSFVLEYDSGNWSLADFLFHEGTFLFEKEYLIFKSNNDTTVYRYTNEKLIQCPDHTIIEDIIVDNNYQSWASNLRIREIPKFRSEVAGKLTKDEEVIYLDQRIDSQITLDVKGLKVANGQWLKIRKGRDLEGWVFSPYLTNILKINKYRMVSSNNLLVIKDEEKDEVLWQDSINLFVCGKDYKFIQGIDYLYAKPFVVLKPYSVGEEIVFNTLIYDLSNSELKAMFVGNKVFYGISKDMKYVLYKNKGEEALFVYSLIEKRVRAKVENISFFHSWEGNKLVYYVAKEEEVANEGQTIFEKVIWEDGISENTGIFELYNELKDGE